MEFLNRTQLREQINRLSTAKVPLLFLIDFKGERGFVVELSKLVEKGIYCSIDGVELGKIAKLDDKLAQFETEPLSFDQYKESFDAVHWAIARGDTYLLNLTCATRLHGDLDFRSIYSVAKSRYKFMIEDQFVFYSPEPFLRIENDKIYSFPMKGTIDANIEQAELKLINSQKELREHYTIVDLIRNDLSIVATSVVVEDFRYVEQIKTADGCILQTSSRISGAVSSDWEQRLGDILLSLLPAGSVSGAPKQRTVEIIDKVEARPRGFYTGVMGVCANGRLDSCVNIRYVERSPNGNCYYRSGGGITSLSDAKEEYQELLTKIYVPTV